MSRKFNPLSTAVAVATASLVIGIAGCASHRSADETAGLSRDADTQPTLAQATPTNPLDTTSQPNAMDSTTVAMPAETPSAAIPPAAISDTQPATAPVQTEMTTTTTTETTAPVAPAYQSSPEIPASTASTTTTTTDTSSSNNYNNEQALPPRQDRH